VTWCKPTMGVRMTDSFRETGCFGVLQEAARPSRRQKAKVWWTTDGMRLVLTRRLFSQ